MQDLFHIYIYISTFGMMGEEERKTKNQQYKTTTTQPTGHLQQGLRMTLGFPQLRPLLQNMRPVSGT